MQDVVLVVDGLARQEAGVGPAGGGAQARAPRPPQLAQHLRWRRGGHWMRRRCGGALRGQATGTLQLPVDKGRGGQGRGGGAVLKGRGGVT